MRNASLLIISFVFIMLQAGGQNQPVLTPPSTPAFSILDFEPSAILKPGSIKELGADVLSSFDENGKLKMNLGLEFSPYWLQSRPKLTAQQYNYPTVGQTMLQTLNISAATVRDSFNNTNRLGIGFRVNIVNGRPNDEYIAKQKELITVLNVQALANAGRVLNFENVAEARTFMLEGIEEADMKLTPAQRDSYTQLINKIAATVSDTKTGVTLFFNTLVEEMGVINGPVITKVYELSRKRTGLFIELAGAGGFSNTPAQPALERAGVWITASNYHTADAGWHINARCMLANRDTAINNFDLGFAYHKEMTRFSLGIEGMLRWYRAEIPDFNLNNQPIIRIDKDFTYRLAIQSAYLITDGVGINLSLGKDFDSPYFDKSGFFSILGFNYSLFRKVQVPVAKPTP